MLSIAAYITPFNYLKKKQPTLQNSFLSWSFLQKFQCFEVFSRNCSRDNLNVEGLSADKLNFLSFLAMHYMEKTSNEKEKTLLSNMTGTILVFL